MAERPANKSSIPLKSAIRHFIIEALIAHDNRALVSSHTPSQQLTHTCGLCLVGALAACSEGILDNRITLAKGRPKPRGLYDNCATHALELPDESRFLTALLGFLVRMQHDGHIAKFILQLDDTSACQCSSSSSRSTLLEHEGGLGDTIQRFYDNALTELNRNIQEGVIPGLLDLDSSPSRPKSIGAYLLPGRAPSYFTSRQQDSSPSLLRRSSSSTVSVGAYFVMKVFIMLDSKIAHHASVNFKTSKRRSRHWPHSPKDLLRLFDEGIRDEATDPEFFSACTSTLLRTLRTWTTAIQHPMPSYLLISIINMCGPLVIPTLVESSFCNEVIINGTKNLVDTVLDALQRIQNFEQSPYEHSSSRYVAMWALNRMDLFSQFFSSLLDFTRTKLSSEWYHRVRSSLGPKLAQLCTMLMYLMDDSRIPMSLRTAEVWKEARGSIADLCFESHIIAVAAMKRVPSSPPHLQCHPGVFQADASRSHPVWPTANEELYAGVQRYTYIIIVLQALSRDRSCCFTVGCSNSMQLVGSNFKACSGCGIAKYCGKRCQKLDWKGLRRSGEPISNGSHELRHSTMCTVLKGFSGRHRLQDAKEIEKDPHFEHIIAWAVSQVVPRSEDYLSKIDGSGRQQRRDDEDKLRAEEVARGWEDFDGILTQFQVLGGGPELSLWRTDYHPGGVTITFKV